MDVGSATPPRIAPRAAALPAGPCRSRALSPSQDAARGAAPSPALAPGLAVPARHVALVLLVYGYQGVVAGFALTAVPNWAAGLGASPLAIGAHVALVGLPWTVQPLWGPVVDRLGGPGRRRPFVLAGLAGAAGALGLVALAGEGAGALARLGPLLALHGLCATLVDTALDAWLIDRVPARGLGRVTALTRIGFAGGTALGAAGFAALLPAWGMAQAGWMLAGAAALALAAVLAVREEPVVPPATAPGGLGGALRIAFARPRLLLLLLLGIGTECAAAAFGLRLSVGMVREGGWDPAVLSASQAALALLGGTVGAFAIGAWVDRAGALPALRLLLAAAAAAFALAAAALPWLPGAAAPALAFGTLLPMFVFVALAAVVMGAVRGGAAATLFALFMAALNLGGVAGAALSGPLASVAPGLLALAAAAVFAASAAAVPRAAPLRR